MKSIKDHHQHAKNQASFQKGELTEFSCYPNFQSKTVKINYSIKSVTGTTSRYSFEISFDEDVKREMLSDYPEFFI